MQIWDCVGKFEFIHLYYNCLGCSSKLNVYFMFILGLGPCTDQLSEPGLRSAVDLFWKMAA